ncbi:MAG TPA: hypothetical protein VEQ38_26150 [Verrucomicrobiae bacterium]|nr:hypothetical protein [Verrucomicrobiae bacterium]
MPAGDRQRTWFPEMVETLRAEWGAQMSWDDLIALCDRLDSVLQHIRHSRNITPATTSTLCPCCGGPMVQGAASVSVRATILALGRFGIAPEAEVKLLEKRWKKYRESTGCDVMGNSTLNRCLELFPTS